MGLIQAVIITQPGAKRRDPESDMVFGSALTTALALGSLALAESNHQSSLLLLFLASCAWLLTSMSPSSYGPFNRALFILVRAMAQMVTMLFWVGYILPSGLLMQARGNDPLRLKFNARVKTYWEESPAPGNMQRAL